MLRIHSTQGEMTQQLLNKGTYMKHLKWLIGIFVGLLALFVLAIVLLVNFINPNDYRAQISQVISEKIQQPFAIQGDISWVIFPTLGFKVQDMSIGKSDGNNLYAKINALEINLQLLPLLEKKISLNALKVDGLTMNLPASSASPTTTSAKPKVDTAATKAVAGAPFALPELSLSELSVNNANISQLDSNGKTLWSIKNFTMESTNLRKNILFPIQTRFHFSYPTKNFDATVRLATQIDWKDSKQILHLKTPKLFIDNDKNSALPIELDLDIRNFAANLADHSMLLEGIEGSLNQLNFSGKVSVQNFDTTPSVSGVWNMDADNLKAVLNSFKINLPKMQGASALTKFSFKTQYQYSNNQLTLSPFSIQLDNNTINGSVKSPDIKNMALTVALQSPKLSLGDYLAPSAQNQNLVLTNTQLNFNFLPPTGSDKNWLASTLNGSLGLQSASYNGQTANNVQLQLDGKNQIFNINKFQAAVWQGSVSSTAQINMQGNSPKVVLNPNIQNIQILNLLKMFDPNLQLTGLANLNGSINFMGSTATEIKKNLNGNLKVQIKDGVLHGVDIGYWVNMASALYHKESLPAQPKGLAKTAFGTLTASFNLNNGIASNNDLFLQGPIAQAKGQGTIDLNRESLNYRLNIAKTNQATGKAHNDIVPLIITGPFDNPSVQPDMEAIAKAVINNQLGQQKDKLVKQLEQTPVGQQIGTALGQLLG